MSRYPNLEVFAPSRYSYSQSNYTGTIPNNRILTRNNRRVWFAVRFSGLVLPVSSFISFDGTGATAPQIEIDLGTTNIFNWTDYYVLVQSEVFIDFTPGPNTIHVTEIVLNETRVEDTKRANDLLRLAEKKVSAFERWRGRPGYTGNNILIQGERKTPSNNSLSDRRLTN